MFDESMGKNTAIKKLFLEKLTENIEIQKRLGHHTEDLFCKDIKVTNLKKKGMLWTATYTISYTVEGNLHVHYVNQYLARKKIKNEEALNVK